MTDEDMGGKPTCCAADQVEGRCCQRVGDNGKGTTEEAPYTNEVMGVPPTAPPGVCLKAALVPGGSAPTANTTAGGDEGGGPDASRGAIASKDVGEAQTITYDDGSTYTGQVVDGLRHGHGIRECSTGSYEGQWEADTQHGRGKQIWTDGRTFEGDFVHGKFDGYGKMVWHTQKGLLVYEGQYKADLKHGSGKFAWGDGRIYDGEWNRGMRHGRGKYTNANSQEKVGYWVEDKFDRWESTAASDIKQSS